MVPDARYFLPHSLSLATLWNDVLSGTVAGLVSGLLVAVALWTINHFRSPKFEYFDVGGGRAHFHYNRLRPIIIGGTWQLCHGTAMVEQNPRGGSGGFYMGPKSDQVFATSEGHDSPLEVGTQFVLAYRIAPLRMWFSQKARDSAFNIQMDPLTVLNSKSNDLADPEKLNESERRAKGWKVVDVPLLPSATK